jgi:hypothetical protein
MYRFLHLLTYFFCFLFLSQTSIAQKKALTYYLPDIRYDKNIPSPEEFLGWQIGEWHVSHDNLVAYMRSLATKSTRIKLEEYGRSYEQRPLLLLTITSPENQARLADIKAEHLALCTPSTSAKIKTDKLPIVVYQGHSIHGNEASGANAAMLMAYYWAAGQSEEIEQTLQNTVILFDPAFNPDGLQRFSTWVNMHKSKNLVSDPASREFNEMYPFGRTNHYWFDLNRDWLVSQMPETRGRVANFQTWKPNIFTDHHEMGSNNSFFFMPGTPSRVNPITPKRNQELTAKIAQYHAKALDAIGSMYYSQEDFDDFYYGKGSTYPDAQGCIGILFEQGSSRGHLQRTTNGLLSFPFTIRNQVTTSFSTIRAAQGLRKELLDYQKDFFQTAQSDGAKDERKAYIVGETSNDRNRFYEFGNLLLRNKIEFYELGKTQKGKESTFEAGKSYVIPLEQPQYRLVRGMFEKQTTFEDSIFYDISAWTLPLAFNLNFTSLGATFNKGLLGRPITQLTAPQGDLLGGKTNYAYVFAWNEYTAPNLLNQLLSEGILCKVATKAMTLALASGESMAFDAGAILIPLQNQSKTPEAITEMLRNGAQKNGINLYAAGSGLTPEGNDLGSPSFANLRKPTVLLLLGEGISNNDVGEVWHLLDQRYDMQVTMVEAANLGKVALEKYNTIVFCDGTYSNINGAKIQEWSRAGGTIIGIGSSIKWLKDNNLANIKFKFNAKKEKSTERRPYENAENDLGANIIGGAIFEAELDLTHPLGYGFTNKNLPVFRNDTLLMEVSSNVYATPLQYKSSPLIAGYIAKKNLENLKNSAAIIVCGHGAGRVICMSDNPNFRAFWYGTNKLFANALFFGNTISSNALERYKVD